MPKTATIFPWNNNFDTGLIEIDVQHQILMELLNRLANHLDEPLASIFDDIIVELTQYAEFHFSTEDAIWQQYFNNDDWNVSHRASHANFVQDVLNIKHDTTLSQQDKMQKIVSFLKDWLAFHIIDSDKRMARVVLAMQRGSSLVEAKNQILAEIFSS